MAPQGAIFCFLTIDWQNFLARFCGLQNAFFAFLTLFHQKYETVFLGFIFVSLSELGSFYAL